MSYNYRKLLGRITEVCCTQAEFAKRMGLSERTISLKLNGQVSWKQTEIQKAVEVLGLGEDEIQPYFFDLMVQNN